MPIAFVQLSDLHLHDGSEGFLRRANSVVDAITSLDPTELEVVLLWTGDLTFCGTASQFSLLTPFIDELESALQRHPSVSFLGSAFIPGNHDCDFSLITDARNPLISSIGTSIATLEADGATVREISSVQEMFFTFLKSRKQPPGNRLLWHSTFRAKSGDLHIRCCNTAWMSELHEQPGTLFSQNNSLLP